MPLDATQLEVGPANAYFDNVLLGYMGDNMSINIETAVVPLTGAQAGTSPLDKVVSGGRVFVTVPLKEITLTFMAKGILNSTLVTGATSGTRLDVKNNVGLSARSLARELRVIKVVGTTESVLAEDRFIFPEASPADSTVVFPFSPTEQRVIEVTFEAWPNGVTGRWMYVGDETPV